MFRGGKYWQFDNKPKPDKPFGELVDGAKPAKDKWKAIHFPCGVCTINENMIVVYKNIWSKYTSDKTKGETNLIDDQTSLILNDTSQPSIETLDLPINEPIRDPLLPDDPPKEVNDGGALINPDKEDPTYRKINGDRVCRYVLKNDKCLRKGKCITVEDDKNKYPARIVAAIKSSDNNWYFVNKNGKHCQRKDGSTEEVSHS